MTKHPELQKLQPHEVAVIQQLQLWEQAGLGFVAKPFAEQLKNQLRRPSAKLAPPTPTSCSGDRPAAVNAPRADRGGRIATPSGNADEPPPVGVEASATEARALSAEESIDRGGEAQQPYPSQLAIADRAPALHVLSEEVAACRRCDALVRNRTQTVFGVGNPHARLCFVGEAPGADEDRVGEPFVGAAGQLLNKILAACKLDRNDVYILNTIKCRPPGNRNPSEDEISSCWHFARRQLEILQPEYICCLGGIAVRSLLGAKQSIARMRGKFHPYRGSRVVVTYHPAYLLREPRAKYQVWDDMKMLMREMGVEL